MEILAMRLSFVVLKYKLEYLLESKTPKRLSFHS